MAIAVITGVALSWATTSASRAYRAGRGEDIPRDPPEESNRVRHPQGFSIVFPPNWSVQVVDPPEIRGVPKARTSIGGDPARIVVARLGARRPAETAGYRATTFQGEPAFADVRDDGPSGSPRFERSLLFRRGGSWYLLRYSVGEARESLPWMIQRYFDTFQAKEDGA